MDEEIQNNRYPVATIAIAAILVISYFLFSSAVFFPQDLFVNNLALSREMPYNIIFHEFVHSSYAHLIANLCMIIFAGIILEPMIARKHIIALFALGSIFSGIGFILTNPEVAIIGASGGGVALITAAIIANPQKALFFILLAIVVSFAAVQGISVIVDQKENQAKEQVQKLQIEMETAAQRGDATAVLAAKRQISDTNAEILAISRGKNIQHSIRPNFELHAFGSIFAALYMFIFNRKIVERTVKVLAG